MICTTKRKKTSRATETKVLIQSGRWCCLCFGINNDFTEKRGQIAHLDKNPSNADLDNLAYVYLEHHDLYDSRHSQSKGFTIQEAKYYRALLHEAILELRKNDDDIEEASVPRDNSENTVRFLSRIKTGKELVDIATNSHFYALTMTNRPQSRNLNFWVIFYSI